MLSVPIGAQELTIAGIMIIILVFRPDGIMGGREVPWPFGKAGRIVRDAGAAEAEHDPLRRGVAQRDGAP